MTTRHYVEGPAGQIHLRSAGHPGGPHPTLVCFHMSPMSSRTYDRFLDAFAAGGRHAVAIDLPGMGMSDAPAAAPGIEEYAAAMLAAIDALDLPGPVDLMGYHTGSMVAAELAVTSPALVRRIVMVSAPIFTETERAALIEHYRYEPPALDGSHLVTRWNSFVHHHLGRGQDLDQVADAFPERLLGRARSGWGHRAAFAYPFAARLAQVAQPLLVINPNDDLTAETRRAGPLLRNGRILERPEWGHGFLDGDTAAAVTLVRNFLAS